MKLFGTVIPSMLTARDTKCTCVLMPAGNSTGKGTHVLGFLNLMKGPYNNELT